MSFLVKRTTPASRDVSIFDLHKDMDNLFGSLMRGFDAAPFQDNTSLSQLTPRLDISETEKEYQVTAELPGVEEKDLDITLTKGLLTIKGEKKADKEEKGKNYHRIERTYGSFERSISLPQDADQQNVSADFNRGVLKVTVAKKPEAIPTTRKIEVKSPK